MHGLSVDVEPVILNIRNDEEAQDAGRKDHPDAVRYAVQVHVDMC